MTHPRPDVVTVTVVLGHDMHAQPLTRFCAAVRASGSPVTLGRPGAIAVNAHEPLRLMATDLRAGERVELSVTGPTALLQDLAAMLSGPE